MSRARSLIGRGDLPRDLFAERHAGNKMRRVQRLMEGGACPALDGTKAGPTAAILPPETNPDRTSSLA